MITQGTFRGSGLSRVVTPLWADVSFTDQSESALASVRGSVGVLIARISRAGAVGSSVPWM